MTKADELLGYLAGQREQEWYRWVVDVWAKGHAPTPLSDPAPPHYSLTPEETIFADAEAKRRDETSSRRSPNSVYDPGEVMSRIQNIRACRSELSLARYLDLEWTGHGQQGLHRADVGDFYEVRAVDQPRLGLIVREKDADRPFVLALVLENKVWFRGWDWAHDVRTNLFLRRGSSKSPTSFWLKSPPLLQPFKTLPDVPEALQAD